MSDAETSRARSELDEQTKAFLSKGGEIKEIPTGATGWDADRKKSQWTKAQARKPETESQNKSPE
ncbi:hypothetical protein [Metapseudomonas resinovorans]|uniref:Transcriptional regulator SutA RNAP-binding domain-containing protein n=1 Tax=Metapseudomonas resinovorans NBRC 106553 TaxID=1245471 RepID=S6AIM7_METRE|nr:hypothetical protein PCA10_25330 [Pseudomonas resinovorans NBRC 106553]